MVDAVSDAAPDDSTPVACLEAPGVRLRAYLQLIFTDYGFLRAGFQNAHWISDELARSSQPWPFHLNAWKRQGIRTVVNLRGEVGSGMHALEREACARLGMACEDFTIYSRAVPTREQVEGAKALFDRIAYPALIHCKSGADRAGIMSVFYKHFRQSVPLREAVAQLSLSYGHVKAGLTGVLDYTFQRYFEDGEPRGLTFLEWVSEPGYDPDAIKADFKAAWWGTLLTEKILRRE